MRRVEDQMGRVVHVPDRPSRIVSLVPSQTELLFDLGAGDRVVGVTRFCIRPADVVAGVTRVGGTKQLRLEVLEALAPDLVIGNKEENERAQIEEVATRFPVWLSDVASLDDAVAMIEAVGDLVNATAAATGIVTRVTDGFDHLPAASGLRVLYLIWRNPWMAAGTGTFIDDLLGRCGFTNVLTERALDRYPTLGDAQLRELEPDLVLLSSEPFPFAPKHTAEIAALLPNAAIRLVDGEAFSWFGSRLIESVRVLGELVESASAH